MNKIRILFFIYQMGAGGAARTILNIVNNLDRDKFTPVLVTLNYEGSYEHNVKKDVTFIKLNTKRLRSAIFPLAKVIRREKIDIVFSTIPNYNTIAILAKLFSRSGANIIVREAALLGGNFKADAKLRLYGLLYRLFADRVIALSNGVKDNIVQRYKVKKDNITVIYNPVDTESIEHSAAAGSIEPDHEAIFQKEGKIIVTAGRLVKDKDHDTLLKAFAQLVKDYQQECRLVILGEGERKQELLKLAEELQIKEQVHFLGFQKNPYIYFKKSDLFVLSSIREGFGHVLAEALTVGIPVVSTNCRPGAIEVLDGGKYGVLCQVGNPSDMAEKMHQVLTLSDEERITMIEKGKERAMDFQAKTIVRQYETVFAEVAERGIRRGRG